MFHLWGTTTFLHIRYVDGNLPSAVVFKMLNRNVVRATRVGSRTMATGKDVRFGGEVCFLF